VPPTVPPTLPPTLPPPTVRPTLPPPQWPTSTPVQITEFFRPAPSTGGQPLLGVPTILWATGLGLVLVGLGLTWRRRT
jgi:hypothetical protein